MELPWAKWFMADWMGDPALSRCTPATRGVWMDLLCAMLLGDRTGQISATPEEFSRVCRCSVADVCNAKMELANTNTAEVTERNGVVTFSCRRLLREANARKSSAERKKRFDAKRRHPPNAESNGDVTPQRLEARGQKSEKIAEMSTSPLCSKRSKSAAKKASKHGALITLFCDLWRKANGEKYPFAGGKDAVAAQTILKACGGTAKAEAVFERYFADQDQFVAKQGYSLSWLASRLPTYMRDNGNEWWREGQRPATPEEVEEIKRDYAENPVWPPPGSTPKDMAAKVGR